MEFVPGPAGEPNDLGAAPLSPHVHDAIDEVAPAQRDRFRDPQPAVIQQAYECVIARLIGDGVEQHEDLCRRRVKTDPVPPR